MKCQPSLISWGDQSIAWIAENLRESWLTPLMINISELGHAGPILVMIALGYWFWNRRASQYIAYSVFLALLLNLWIKGVVMECRPPSQFWLEYIKNSYSFPSGHAQVSIALWAGFAYYLRSKWLSFTCLLIGILIALSRPYMGVHYIHDIVVGTLLGLLCLALCIYFDKKHLVPFKRLSLSLQSSCLLLLLILYNWIVNNPSGNSIRATGAFFGFWLGCQWIRSLNFNAQTRYLPLPIQAVMGFGVMFLLFNKISFDNSELSSISLSTLKFSQFALLGWWIAYGAPFFFMKGILLHKKAKAME